MASSPSSSIFYASVLLLCGLPGSGKSTLVQQLKLHATSYYKVLVIDYDKIAEEIEERSNLRTYTPGGEAEQSAVKGNARQNNTSQDATFDSADLEAWRQSRIIALNKLKDALHSHFSHTDDVSSSKSLLVIMDDNFHLKSMRREIYRACQEVVEEFTLSTIGFVTLYVSTPLDVCMEQNNRREGKQRVPDDVITRMTVAMEPPDPSKPYGSFERFHLTVSNTDNEDSSSMNQRIISCLNEALSDPVTPKCELSAEELYRIEAEKARQREETQKCQLQQIDQLLRKLVGAVGRTDKSKSKMANEARKKLLDGCKSNLSESVDVESLVNDFTLLVLGKDAGAELDVDSPLVHSIKTTFNDVTGSSA